MTFSFSIRAAVVPARGDGCDAGTYLSHCELAVPENLRRGSVHPPLGRTAVQEKSVDEDVCSPSCTMSCQMSSCRHDFRI